MRALEASLRGDRGFAQRALVVARSLVEAWEHALVSEVMCLGANGAAECTKLAHLNERITGVRVKIKGRDNDRERALRALGGLDAEITAGVVVGHMIVVEQTQVDLVERVILSPRAGEHVRVKVMNHTAVPCKVWVTFLGQRTT